MRSARFQPIQQQPTSVKLKKADYLFECLERLICHSVSAALSSPATSSSSSTSTSSPHSPSLYQFVLPQEDVTILAAKILENLAEYLADDYISISPLIPFLVRLLEEHTNYHSRKRRPPCPHTAICPEVCSSPAIWQVNLPEAVFPSKQPTRATRYRVVYTALGRNVRHPSFPCSWRFP